MVVKDVSTLNCYVSGVFSYVTVDIYRAIYCKLHVMIKLHISNAWITTLYLEFAAHLCFAICHGNLKILYSFFPRLRPVHCLLFTMNPHTLEIAYERSQRVVDATIDGEKTRLFRLQIWCLEEENNALHGQLSGRTGYMSQLENAIHQAREETRTKEEAITQLEQILQVKVRDNANLKVHLNLLLGK